MSPNPALAFHLRRMPVDINQPSAIITDTAEVCSLPALRPQLQPVMESYDAGAVMLLIPAMGECYIRQASTNDVSDTRLLQDVEELPLLLPCPSDTRKSFPVTC